MTTRNIAEIVYREDLYPRFKPNPAAIIEYSINLDVLPPIEVNQNNILIDGYHRLKAHETAEIDVVTVIVTETDSEEQLFMLAVQRNSIHGQQLTQKEKKKLAVRWWDVMPDEDICKTLSITKRLFSEWTKDKQKDKQEEIKQTILDMHLACYTQQSIAEAVDLSQPAINEIIAEIIKKDGNVDSDIFSNFEERQLYTIWNIGKATNEVKHFGNIPPEIIDNLLFLYTKPFDVVFDPFGGGGSTLDMCQKRMRRCYISDLNPIPAREQDIRQHDITSGLPADLPVPDLVFLDPPYWQQAKHKYSKDGTDLANIELDVFLDSIGKIAQQVKRKWAKKDNGTLALIIGPWKEDGKKIDLPFLCYQKISKYLPLKERVIVSYSTQVHGGAFVKMAKDKKELLYLHRDLMIFGGA